MVWYRSHGLETHSNVESRRLKGVRRYEHDLASLRARVLLNCAHELTAKPSATRSLGNPQISDVAAAAPGVSADPSLNVTGDAFMNRSKRLAIIMSGGSCVVLVDALGEKGLDLRSVASTDGDRHSS